MTYNIVYIIMITWKLKYSECKSKASNLKTGKFIIKIWPLKLFLFTVNPL